MSSKAAVIWLLVAIILGAAAVLLLRSPAGRGGAGGTGAAPVLGDRLLTLDPATVGSISVLSSDGGSEILTRTTEGEWMMTVRPAGAAASPRPSWPVPSSRVQSLLRQIGDSRVQALPPTDAALGSRPVTVTITTDRPTPVVLRLADQSLAGKALIELDEAPPAPAPAGKVLTRRALIDDTLHQLFRDHAPRQWRDRTAMAGLGLDASRITLTNNQGSKLALGKVDGAWSVREPFSAPADPAAIQRLLQMITALQIVDFLDDGVNEPATHLDAPAAAVTIETDRREPATDPAQRPTTVVDTRDLAIGSASDAAGTRLFARIDGERTVIIDARAVADLKLDPAPFVWAAPTRLNPSDIGTIAIERITPATSATTPGSIFRRDLQRWKQIRPDGQELFLPDLETRPVVALLGFLCEPPKPAPGAAPALGGPAAGPSSITGAPPEGLAPLGRITLLSLSGGPLDTLEIGSAKPGTLTIRTAQVYRTYPLDRVPALLAELAQQPAAAPAAADATPPEASK